MTYRIPADSADARELREALAEAEAEARQPALHDPRCVGGWLGDDPEGRPIPCLQCRPHLAGARRDVSNV